MDYLALLPLSAVVGGIVGWYAATWHIRRRNRRLAKQMLESVRASKSRRDPANMMNYNNRQRTAGNADNPTRAKIGAVHFRSKPMPRR